MKRAGFLRSISLNLFCDCFFDWFSSSIISCFMVSSICSVYLARQWSCVLVLWLLTHLMTMVTKIALKFLKITSDWCFLRICGQWPVQNFFGSCFRKRETRGTLSDIFPQYFFFIHIGPFYYFSVWGPSVTKVHHLPNQRAIMNIFQPNGYPSTSSQNKCPPAI